MFRRVMRSPSSFETAHSHPAPKGMSTLSLADQLRGGTIVVAVTGGSDADGAISVSHGLQSRYGAAVRAVQVLDTSPAALPMPLPSLLALGRDLIGDAPYAEDVRARRQQFADVTDAPNAWPVHVALGTPAEEILRYARRHGAALITMGLRRHPLIDRVFRDETTLTVARHARALVLGVVPSLRGLPRRAIVGVDFGPASIRAARAALDVVARPVSRGAAALRLVYVNRDSDAAPQAVTTGDKVIERLGVRAGFEQLIQELEPPAYVRVDWTVLSGAPAQAMLAFATDCEADLIALGSVRHERVERWMLGSVTTDVIRDGRCSVLVIPPPLSL